MQIIDPMFSPKGSQNRLENYFQRNCNANFFCTDKNEVGGDFDIDLKKIFYNSESNLFIDSFESR